MAHVAISAIGSDAPGIVAALTGVLWEQGCNLEDTSMSILRGHFAMMLVVAVPEGMTAGDLEARLAATGRAHDLVVVVRHLDDDVAAKVTGTAWTVSVYGADRPGIVHQVTRLLAEAGVNIVDLTTRVIGEPDRAVYAMFLDVTVPPRVDVEELAQHLDAVGLELGVSCSLHTADADIF